MSEQNRPLINGDEPLILDPGAKQRKINKEARVQTIAELLVVRHLELTPEQAMARSAAFVELCDERLDELKKELTPRVVVPNVTGPATGGRFQ